jgi:hypothetical protein
MFKRGILTFESLNFSDHSIQFVSAIQKIFSRYLEIIIDYLALKNLNLFSLSLVIFIVFNFIKLSNKQKYFFLITFFAPLSLLLWHYRDPNHSFIGLEIIIYLIASSALINLDKKNIINKAISIIIFCTLIFLQITHLLEVKKERSHYFGIQKGALLKEQLALIDISLNVADNKIFSFSTLTSPYNINSTWSYLYTLQAKENSKNIFFVGMPQTGFPGDNSIKESTETKDLHFTIFEPDTTLTPEQISEFEKEQNELAGTVVKSWQSGSLIMQLRQKSN